MGRTQTELADTISQELKISLRTGRKFIKRLLELVADDLVETERVELRGLGIFAVHTRPERHTVHPGTGQPITVPARKAVRYRSSVALRRRLNASKVRLRRRK